MSISDQVMIYKLSVTKSLMHMDFHYIARMVIMQLYGCMAI